MMSQGTFLELLDLAARRRGLRADIELFPEGEFGPDKPDTRPTARIRLTATPPSPRTRCSSRFCGAAPTAKSTSRANRPPPR